MDGSSAPRLVAVHACPTWLPATQTWMYNQARFLPQNIETHIVCEQTAHLDQFDLPNIHCLTDQARITQLLDRTIRKLGLRRHLAFLRRAIQTLDADVVHSHFGPTAWRNVTAVRGTGARHFVSFYGADATQTPQLEPGIRAKYHELFDDVDAVFCEGPAMAASIGGLGCPTEKVRIHHLGVDLDTLPYRPRTWSPGEPFRVLMSATFREKKGLTYGIRALGAIKDRVDVALTIIGDATAKPGDIEEKSRILEATEASGLMQQTRFLGFQPHDVVLQEALRSHVFVSPSVSAADGDSEGGAPVTIIEMAALGVPVVSSAHCDIPQVILNGVSGWLAGEKDVDGLVRHLTWLVEHPDDWITFLDAGRRHIEEQYDCRKQGERLAKLYAETLESS